MKAYHNDPAIKAGILAQLAAHREADQLVKGQYWKDGKGCAVGCTIHSHDHMEYEYRFGIPVMLARLEDTIFEGLPNDIAQAWPERFMGAIEVGADLSLVGWKFLHWLLTDETVNPGITHPDVRDAVRQCADLIAVLKGGGTVTANAAWSATDAAWSARDAARSVGRAAVSAAGYAVCAAWSAAKSARDAAKSARDAAWYAADCAADCAADAAWSAAYVAMADKLIELIEETKA